MDRKDFLVTTGFAAFSMSAIGAVVTRNDGGFKGDCETTNDILGPFYRPDAPIRSDLTFEGLEGNRITLKGNIYGPDCKTALKDALIEVWHCDTQGEYDNHSDDFKHRAGWKTKKDGEYSFKTILPGKYLNGRLYRPAHIHIRVKAEGHRELISQVYFSGDPHITEDPWASQPKAEHRILQLSPDDIHGGLVVHFDVFLAKA